MVVHIQAIYREVKGEYGWPRIHQGLRRRRLRVGKERVRLLMQAHGVRGRVKRKYVSTTDAKHALAVAPMLVDVGVYFFSSRSSAAWAKKARLF